MSESLFLRIKSLNVKTMHGVSAAKNVIKVAAMHNLREIVAEFGVRADSNIDLARVALNYQLRGPATAAGVADLALALLSNAGVHKLRKDACMALEVVFSLPPGSAVDHREFFGAAVVWADAFFNVPILSAAVHLDESAPHCHVLLLPLVGGRMKGGALGGGPTKIKMMLSDFQQQVGQRFGLTHQPRAKRLSKTNRDAAGRMVLDALKSHPERFNVPAVRDVLVAALGAHHETLLPLLGLTLPTPAKRKANSFAAMMTAPCKPEPTERTRTSIDVAKPKSIDVAQRAAHGDIGNSATSMLCIDVAPLVTAFPANDQRQLATDNARNSEQVSTPASPTPAAVCSAAMHSAEIPAHCSSPSAKANTGKSRNYGNDSQPDEIHRPVCPAPMSPASTAPAAIYDDARKSAHTSPEESGRAGGAGFDDFQRQRDDDLPAEHWNPDTGEFISTTSAPARPSGRHGRAPYSARASPADIARALLALAGTTEPKTPVRAESEP